MAGGMCVTEGLRDHQVLQRGKNGLATATAGGLCGAGGKVETRVIGKDGRQVQGWKAGGTADKGAWCATVRGLPVGGPYEVQFRVGSEAAAVKDVLVGDLWVLGGQSNMEGCAGLSGPLAAPHPLVHSYGMDEQWAVAEEPLHWLNESIDPCHNADAEVMARRIADGLPAPARRPWRKGRLRGAGCGLTFAREMLKLTGVPVGLVPCAHGGTSMAQWDPALSGQGGRSLYGSMLRRVKLLGGKVAGVLWYQGESDADHARSKVFIEANVKLVRAMRRDFGNPRLPFLYAQIGWFGSEGAGSGWNMLQQHQLTLETLLAPAGMVPVIDLQMEDFIHIGSDAQIALGKRLATVARRVALGDKSVKTGPRPTAIWAQRRSPDGVIRIRFSGVNGKLVSKGRPSGFAVIDPNGSPRMDNYRVILEGNTVVLKMGWDLIHPTRVAYGKGLSPYCNVTDEADLPVPVCGPFIIQDRPNARLVQG